MQPDASALRDFAVRYTAAWCSQDPARVASFFAPGGSLAVNDSPPAIGRDAITEVARSFMMTFPDMRVAMDDVRVTSDSVEYHWTLTGTNTGPGGTGRRVRMSGLERGNIGPDGLIASSLGSFDSADYARQLEGVRLQIRVLRLRNPRAKTQV